MPALPNQRHEQFAQHLADGKSATEAYRTVYGQSKFGRSAGSRLSTNVNIRSRVVEIHELGAQKLAKQAEILVKTEIARKTARVRQLEERRNTMRAAWDLIIAERGEELKDISGGSSGFIVRDYKGRNADQPVYKVDTGLIAMSQAMAELEHQAAQELGQWITKTESTSVNLNVMIERLNAGRKRMNEMRAERERRQITPGSRV